MTDHVSWSTPISLIMWCRPVHIPNQSVDWIHAVIMRAEDSVITDSIWLLSRHHHVTDHFLKNSFSPRNYAGVSFLLRKSVWRSPFPRDELGSKIRFCSTQFSIRKLWSRVQIRFCSTFQKFEFLVLLQFRFEVRIWNKTGNSNYWKVEQNRNWTRDHSFRREIVWSKIGFSNKIHPRVHAARNTMQKRFVDWQKSIG